MSLEYAVKQNAFLMGYADSLTNDLSAEQFLLQPMDGVNNPAWVIGHLANTADNLIGMIGGEKILDGSWKVKFGGGSSVSSNPEDYPSKEELLNALRRTNAKLRELSLTATSEILNAENPVARLKSAGMTTLGDLLGFVLTGHVGTHLGQLSAFRRMVGLPPLF